MVCHFSIPYKFGNRGSGISKKTMINDHYSSLLSLTNFSYFVWLFKRKCLLLKSLNNKCNAL